MSQTRGNRWYKKEGYKTPRDAFDPGDGSVVEIVAEEYKGHPFALKITRVWPDDRVSTIYLDPPREGLNPSTTYLFVDDPAPAEKAKEFIEAVESGTYRPYLQLSAVPGNKPGDTFDVATNQHHTTRAKFNEYYKEHKLEKVSANDSTIPTNGTTAGSYKGRAQQYDPTKPPPVPQEFQGVKFHYGD